MAQTESQPESRQKVAVVLAGGGAKGAAHIGVLKALEELRVPVDVITGTSMGSYVGGLYATGMSADEIESFIETVDWNSGYRDRVDRSQRKVQDKEYEDRYQLTTDLGLRWGEVRASRGIVQGQGMLKLLRETTGNLPPFASFDDLAIPYRSVATDILELKPVVIGEGYLVDAMMASMSVPGALPPYQLNGKMLVDGGVTNNMPVDVAHDLGADVVIAVDIGTEYKDEEDFTTFLTVADQLSNYLVRSTTARQAELLTDEDFFLRPDVGDMETTEFDRMPEAFEKGYQAVMARKEQLQKLSLSSADYQHYIEHKQDVRRDLRYGDEITVEKVVINNHTHYSDTLLENRLELQAGQRYTLKQVEQSVQDLYALDRFELVTYRYDEIDGQDALIVDVNEKSWGPNYLNFRFFLEDDFSTDSQYSIGMSTNFTNLNSHGAELRTNFEIGTDKLIEAELYSPFFSSQKTFTTLALTYSNEKRNAPLSGFDDTTLEATKNYAPISYTEWVAQWALGYQDTLWRRFMAGVRYTDGKGELSSVPSFGDVAFERLGGFANYRIDTLDNYSLPRSGFYLDLNYLVSHDKSVGDTIFVEDQRDEDTSYELGAKMIAAHTFSRHTLVANIDLGFVESKNSSVPIDPEEIGGFLNLSGIPRNSLIGQNKVFGSLVYRYRWFDNDFGLFSSPFYIGASLEYGGVWSDPDIKLPDAPLYTAGSVFAGVDSPIGPVMFAYGRTEQNYDSFYLIIGTTFK
ncbi:patatin-like phospholipase family protein [Vibrio brasiliensis]|uniref:patatin-like phospholipase family protein n=1 Tax=Vibrio brasiliensis TaxID=170652 RepID=UPI001EFEAC6A|nr:patatin-like phospholipase family protein [Vibrio brasiliensis]MCG9749079.1 patatin-like phospholipase family protein [Vibrio brasiliensis]MCG9784469.1 patatin-like phospholipase family protein [Vibrio brasiliensis]